MAYPTTEQLHDHVVALASENAPFGSIIKLKKSVQGTDIWAFKMSKGSGGRRAKVLITGGLLGSETPIPKAIVTCMHELFDAYEPPGRGIGLGAYSLTKDDVRDIVEHVDMYVLPLVNPDGYDLALTMIGSSVFELKAGMKNGRVTAMCAFPNRPGVHLNRNFDILWDFERLYALNHNVESSSDPCADFYTGVKLLPDTGGPFSEPEAENVKTLLDEGIEYYVDCFMGSQPSILYPWGIGLNQTDNQNMNFTSSLFDDKRGGTAGSYKEFIPGDELRELENIAGHMATAIETGTNVPFRSPFYPYMPYVPQQAALEHPRSGSAVDYAYSRHRVDPALPFVRAFDVGFGVGQILTDEDYVVFEQEVQCALLSLLQYVATWVAKRNAPHP